MTSIIDTAFNLLEQAIRLEEQGERTSSHEKLNASAVHYFQACNLMKTYLRSQSSTSNGQQRKRELIQQKIDQYESRGRSLIRKVRGAPAPYALVGGEIVETSATDSTVGEEPSAPPLQVTAPLLEASVAPIQQISHQPSMSMIPIPHAYPVDVEEIQEQREEEERSTGEMNMQIKQICEEAECIVKEAIEFDDMRTKDELAISKYKQSAHLFLNAAKMTGLLMQTMEGNNYENIKRYHDYLKGRIKHILDRVEELQSKHTRGRGLNPFVSTGTT